jgi:hypothetical protein
MAVLVVPMVASDERTSTVDRSPLDRRIVREKFDGVAAIVATVVTVTVSVSVTVTVI